MITLNVFVRVNPEHREELLALARTLFDTLAKESTFIDAWINPAVDQSDLVVVYERWNETKESFVQKILPNPFYAPYLALLNESVLVAKLSGWRSVVGGAQRHRRIPNDT
jgi:hypothetical protein